MIDGKRGLFCTGKQDAKYVGILNLAFRLLLEPVNWKSAIKKWMGAWDTSNGSLLYVYIILKIPVVFVLMNRDITTSSPLFPRGHPLN